jgi:hypothetical protein
MRQRKVNRRKFIKTTSTAAAAGAIYMSMPESFKALNREKSRVILIRDENVIDEQYNADPEITKNIFDEAISLLTDKKEIKEAWKEIVKPDDIVGVKSNEWGHIHTPKELESAIKERVLEAGVREDKFSINDRGVLRDDVFLNATALINVRPMRTHHWSGLGTCLKNPIMLDPTPSSYHPDSCADLAKLWEIPLIKGKVRLNILVMYTPLFHGIGPHHFSPKYVWPYKGIIVGFDPVAVDAVGCKIIEAKRNEFFGEERPINPPPKHIELADTRHHLGNASMDKIELIKVGWEKDRLI